MLHSIKTFFAFWILILLSFPAFSQDAMPVKLSADSKMAPIDTLPLQYGDSHQQKKQEDLSNPAADLYPNWVSSHISAYNGVPLPDEYKIDLRGFAMPTPSRNVTSNYGYRPRFGRMHYGTDVKVFVGDTIYAAFDGKVRVVTFQRSGYGNVVVIRHPNGLETVYGHLSKHLVKEKQIVKAGEPIGLGGNTGRSFGSHLHFETRLLGTYIDPALLFNFPKQDVTADFYLFRKNGNCALLGQHTGNGNGASTPSNVLTEIPIPQKAQTAPAQARATHIHKVKKGENLGKIAKKYGITVDKLCRLNGLKKQNALRVGQILKVS